MPFLLLNFPRSFVVFSREPSWHGAPQGTPDLYTLGIISYFDLAKHAVCLGVLAGEPRCPS